MREEQNAIAEMTDGIILASFQKDIRCENNYQSEAELESSFITNLISQGYERIAVKSSKDLYTNLKHRLEILNKIRFSYSEWDRFLKEYLDSPNEGLIEKTRKIQEDYIYDFTFDDGHLQNIKLLDKKDIYNNSLQVVSQVSQRGVYGNRYDVSILVNGLPLVHIELKKRGISLLDAFHQIDRYNKESFNVEHSLYKYVQIFVISNGTYTRYFANTTSRDKNSYQFTCEWADAKNQVICDLEDFTKTFFEKRVILEVLTRYCVFDTNDTLLVMRPYQIAATERILWKIKGGNASKKEGKIDAGGYIWHTTGSGKTLTSFKTAKLAIELDFIDKVFFIVDRKDLDHQTMQEYKRFQKDSVNGSNNTEELKKVIEKYDNKIVVTTIQKLNEFIKKNKSHEIYNKHCVLIFDECHRSQFGETQVNIKKYFKKYYQFGFTGTPIFEQNSLNGYTTSSVFGAKLHSYVITDAIRDKKVLKFKVDYNNLSPKFKNAENENDIERLKELEGMLLHKDRISEITRHILEQFDTKTYRENYRDIRKKRENGFNAMFAVQSIEAAKLYYEEFKRQMQNLSEEKRLRIATIYSIAHNLDQSSKGEIADEGFEPLRMNIDDKGFLEQVIRDYNDNFNSNFSVCEFQNYYKDLSLKVKNKDIDLVIVVGIFLTGFDAPTLNTLFVDKNLKYHGLIQAFSRTNRILDNKKAFGNIVCFRNLENDTRDAIRLFGDKNSANIILERSYKEHIYGYINENGEDIKGYKELCNEMLEKFSNPTEIVLEEDKKEFSKLFGEILKKENILKNFDEFHKSEDSHIISERLKQDMKSVYWDIRNDVIKSNEHGKKGVDYSDVEFQIEFLGSDEFNLDRILTLIFEKSNNEDLKDEISREIRSRGMGAKESLIMEFINKINLAKLKSIDEIFKEFYEFANIRKKETINNLIKEENLKDSAENFINKALNKGFVEHVGVELDNIIPDDISRRNNARARKKDIVLEKIRGVLEVFSWV